MNQMNQMKINAVETIKLIFITICLGTLLIYGVFVAIVVLGALSFDAKSSEAKVRETLLVASNNYQKDGALDIRSAIKEKNIPPDEEWQRLYKYSIVPPLDEALSSNEKQLCTMIRQYEDGRSRFYDIHFFGVSMLMPIRYMWDRSRGGSTALQSAAAKVLGRGSFGKVTEIYNTAWFHQLSEEIKCRVIISALDGSIVKNEKNYQTIKGGYALSHVIFDKSLNQLDYCELAFLSAAFRTPLSSISSKMYLNHRVYTYAVMNNRLSRCLKFDIMSKKLVNLEIDKHPINISGKYRDTPLSLSVNDYIDLKKAVSKAHTQLEEHLNRVVVVEVAIKQGNDTIRIDSLNRNTTGFGSEHTPASLSKLLVAKSAIEAGESISSERLRKLLCHSSPEATADLFDIYRKDITNQPKKYHLTHKVNLKRALNSEAARWSSDDILLFAEDFVSLLKNQNKKIPNAFGRGCTMNVLRSSVAPRYSIFAKSGTAKSNNKTVAKLLLFAIKYEKHSPIILVRIEGENNERGLCEGESCFDNSLFKPFVIAALKFTDKQSLNSKKEKKS